MFNLPLSSVMERKRFVTASPEKSVSQAAGLMASKNVGAVLVIEGGKLVGIFTERDVVFRVVAKGLDPTKTALCAVMTAEPITLSPSQLYGHALVVMQENGFRHVPVVENGAAIGIISARNAMDPELEELISDHRRHEHFR
jgi:CBS domain-containing protein